MPSVSKLVDVEDVRQCVNYGIKEGWSLQDFLDSMEEWDSFVEIRHGHWEEVGQQFFRKHYHNHMVICSECHRDGAIRWDYCPHCGARMDKDV